MISDTYLKMLVSLPEDFFKDWKWKEGDQFFIYNKEWKYVEIQGCVGDYSLYSHTGRICNINETGDCLEGDLIPIPNLEQIIKMSSFDWRIFLYNICIHPICEDNLTELRIQALVHLVNEKYGKTWDGEKWL